MEFIIQNNKEEKYLHLFAIIFLDIMLTDIVSKIKAGRNILTSPFMHNRRTVIFICIISIVSVILTYKFVFDSNESYHSTLLSQILWKLGINETLHLRRFANYSVSLEGDIDCNLEKRNSCYKANKSLVLTFWRESSRDKWLAKNMLKMFSDKNFVRIIAVHDNSNWSSYPDKEQFIWIYVNAQKRFWYLKRFLTPTILRAYKYIWILDDDAQILFEPMHYECVATQLNISLSSPGRVEGIASHDIMRVNNDFVSKIGRRTDFLEIGPIVVGTSRAWECIWHFLSPFVGLGWGLDLIWCRLLAHNCGFNVTEQNICAVLDVFRVNHLSNDIGSTDAGRKEMPAYDQYYGNFYTQQLNIAPLANDLSIHSACTKKR